MDCGLAGRSAPSSRRPTPCSSPGIRDSAPWAVGEALWAGCPVVCLRTAGAAELVQRGGGLAIDPVGPLPRRLAEALATTSTLPRVPVRWSADELSELLPEWYARARSACTST